MTSKAILIPSKMTEGAFQKTLLDCFKNHRNIALYRRNVGVMRPERADGGTGFVRIGQAGQCDIFGFVKSYRCPTCNALQAGIALELELKRDGKKPTKLQQQWIDHCRHFNVIAFYLTPSMLGDNPYEWASRLERMIYSCSCPACVERRAIQDELKPKTYKR